MLKPERVVERETLRQWEKCGAGELESRPTWIYAIITKHDDLT